MFFGKLKVATALLVAVGIVSGGVLSAHSGTGRGPQGDRGDGAQVGGAGVLALEDRNTASHWLDAGRVVRLAD
jgi:hypothetical protein